MDISLFVPTQRMGMEGRHVEFNDMEWNADIVSIIFRDAISSDSVAGLIEEVSRDHPQHRSTSFVEHTTTARGPLSVIVVMQYRTPQGKNIFCVVVYTTKNSVAIRSLDPPWQIETVADFVCAIARILKLVGVEGYGNRLEGTELLLSFDWNDQQTKELVEDGFFINLVDGQSVPSEVHNSSGIPIAYGCSEIRDRFEMRVLNGLSESGATYGFKSMFLLNARESLMTSDSYAYFMQSIGCQLRQAQFLMCVPVKLSPVEEEPQTAPVSEKKQDSPPATTKKPRKKRAPAEGKPAPKPRKNAKTKPEESPKTECNCCIYDRLCAKFGRQNVDNVLLEMMEEKGVPSTLAQTRLNYLMDPGEKIGETYMNFRDVDRVSQSEQREWLSRHVFSKIDCTNVHAPFQGLCDACERNHPGANDRRALFWSCYMYCERLCIGCAFMNILTGTVCHRGHRSLALIAWSAGISQATVMKQKPK